MFNRKITCDTCAKDLTSTGNCVDWRLALTAEPKQPVSGMVTAMHVPRPIESDCHFCGLGCLEVWLCERRTRQRA